jgi:transposase
MTKTRGPQRRHSPEFKLRVCQEIRSGVFGRAEAGKEYGLAASVIQHWLRLYDRGELTGDVAEATIAGEYEAKIAALERKVGQLTMELELLKKTPRLRLVSDSASSSIVSGPPAAPSGGRAK